MFSIGITPKSTSFTRHHVTGHNGAHEAASFAERATRDPTSGTRHPGAVRADETRFRAAQRALDPHHVGDRNALRDADIKTVDLLARRAGLERNQRFAEHLPSEGLYLFGRARQTHAALVAGLVLLELALATPAGLDLGFHPPERAGQVPPRRVYVVEGVDRLAARDQHAELPQDSLGQVLVDVHRSELSMFKKGPHAGCGPSLGRKRPKRATMLHKQKLRRSSKLS